MKIQRDERTLKETIKYNIYDEDGLRAKLKYAWEKVEEERKESRYVEERIGATPLDFRNQIKYIVSNGELIMVTKSDETEDLSDSGELQKYQDKYCQFLEYLAPVLKELPEKVRKGLKLSQ